MDNKKVLVASIKKAMKPFTQKHDFYFLKQTLLVRMFKDTLHIINFDVHAPGFNCHVAIQPLYVPADSIDLSFGNRLNHFNVNLPGTWGYGDEKQVEQELQEVQKLLLNNVLPWFKEVGYPQGIASFLKNDTEKGNHLIVGFPPYLKHLYLGFSQLYLQKNELANPTLEQVLEQFNDDSRTWVVQLKEIVKQMIELNREDQNKVASKLSEFINYTKENLNISNIKEASFE